MELDNGLAESLNRNNILKNNNNDASGILEPVAIIYVKKIE